MQSKQVAVAGILTGAVMTGLGVVVLLAGLVEAERPDPDPATGIEDVGNAYPDVDPLPPLPGSRPSKESSDGHSARPRGAATDPDGATYGSGKSDPSATADPDRPTSSREPDEPAETGGSTPTSGPTRTAEPEPTAEPTESADPTTDPTPTETATPPTEP
ncbi:hypothetical protein SAMN05428985_101157 [Nocardioides sp. YR527]|uniref:hypothetical protein n=1 Tax=Nocardioides sp. YR527 TaxID=1881028 RepID=UPI0008903DEA|nr:hypothetical protein [Nocardioides sp. YR527]SDJ72766.1 hypothetical protein SAMN05428985_101157 [Nocardioides sp. YR527]